MIYHVAFQVCFAINGGAENCTQEKVMDMTFISLFACYSGAKTIDGVALEQFRAQAKEKSLELDSIKTKTRCLTHDETEEFLKKWGADGLMVTGKKF
ncbi:hypothetical protein V2I85_10485 [Pseudomonas viridiflava]|uniref:hypothetical protein n=1 Tax=Pseudomonas viridiflava TaxID=33069 RepID=UPI002E9C1312|nr:hypothetical protein [Pseudomonas viridiflava]